MRERRGRGRKGGRESPLVGGHTPPGWGTVLPNLGYLSCINDVLEMEREGDLGDEREREEREIERERERERECLGGRAQPPGGGIVLPSLGYLSCIQL